MKRATPVLLVECLLVGCLAMGGCTLVTDPGRFQRGGDAAPRDGGADSGTDGGSDAGPRDAGPDCEWARDLRFVCGASSSTCVEGAGEVDGVAPFLSCESRTSHFTTRDEDGYCIGRFQLDADDLLAGSNYRVALGAEEVASAGYLAWQMRIERFSSDTHVEILRFGSRERVIGLTSDREPYHTRPSDHASPLALGVWYQVVVAFGAAPTEPGNHRVPATLKVFALGGDQLFSVGRSQLGRVAPFRFGLSRPIGTLDGGAPPDIAIDMRQLHLGDDWEQVRCGTTMPGPEPRPNFESDGGLPDGDVVDADALDAGAG